MYIRKRLKLSLIAAAVAFSFIFASNAMADDGKAALAWVPEQTMMVMSVDVEQLRTTDIFKDFMGALMKEPDAKEGLEMLKKGADFDPEKDLDSFVLAVPPDVEKTENFLFIAKAKLDEKKFVEFAKAEGAKLKSQKHEGVTWYEIDGEGGMAFDGDHIVVGPKAALKAAIDTKKGKMKAIKKNGKLNKLVNAVDTKSDIWMAVAIPSDLQKQMARENPMAGDIDIKNAHASVDFGSGLKLRVTLGAKSADTAKKLVKMANDALSDQNATQQLKAMGLEAAVTNLKITDKGNDINVKLDLNQSEFDQIMQTIKALAGGF